MFDIPMRGIAGQLAQQGRYGDTTLVHMNPMEVQALAALSPTGQLTTNPVTGQPEAFLLSGLGSLLGNALFGGMLGPQLASVLGSAATTGLVTGDLKKGLMAGISGYGFGNAISEAMKAGASAEVAQEMAAAEAVSAPDLTSEYPVAPDTFAPLTMERPDYFEYPEGRVPDDIMAQNITNLPTDLTPLTSQQALTTSDPVFSGAKEQTFFERFKQPFSSKEGIGAFMSSLSKPGTMLPIYVGEGNIAAMDAMEANRRRSKRLGADRENELRRARMGLYGALQGIQRDYPGLRYTYGRGYAHGGQVKKMARGGSSDEDVPEVILPDPISVQAGLRGAGINTPPPVDYSALHQGGSGYMPGLAPEFMYFSGGSRPVDGGNAGVLPPRFGGGGDYVFGGGFGGAGGGSFLFPSLPASQTEQPADEEPIDWEEYFRPPVIEPTVVFPEGLLPPSTFERVAQGFVDLGRMTPYGQGLETLYKAADWIGENTGFYNLPGGSVDVSQTGPQSWVEYPDGTKVFPDGTVVNPDGTVDPSTTPQPEAEPAQDEKTELIAPLARTSGGGGYVYESPFSNSYGSQWSSPFFIGGSFGGAKGVVEIGDLMSVATGGLLTKNGVKRYQEGGPVMMDEPVDSVSNMEMMLSDMEQPETIDPRSEYDQLVNMTVAAIKGEIEEGADRIIEAFIAEYGPEAFAQLRDAVLKQIVPGAQTEGLIDGNGGGMDDEVDGMIGSEQRVAVSPGEYIIPADVVSGLGDGSTDAGASILDEMLDSIRMARTGTTKQPEPLFS